MNLTESAEQKKPLTRNPTYEVQKQVKLTFAVRNETEAAFGVQRGKGWARPQRRLCALPFLALGAGCPGALILC